MSNLGNVIYSVYVFALPPGPIWFLHAYNLITTALMLAWYLRYEGWPRQPPAARLPAKPQAPREPCCVPSA